jgi:hypothetical protein
MDNRALKSFDRIQKGVLLIKVIVIMITAAVIIKIFL